MVAGKQGPPAPHLADVRCTPLDPLDADIRERLGLQTPHTLRQCLTESSDIQHGDVLVVGGREYPIKAVEAWTWRGGTYRLLVVEELQR